MRSARAIAVVIPALDEAERVGAAVASALGARPAGRGECHGPESEAGAASDGAAPVGSVEVVVVDGGSRDATVEVARSAGARVLESAPGRGLQLDAGWRASGAEAVLFLHADTVLPQGWCDAVSAALEDEAVAGGAFRFGVEERGAQWRVLEWGVALRVVLLGLPYGDQAIFVRRRVLEAVGGVPHVEILEDLDVVRAIKRAGRLRMLPLTARTSARRHRGRLPSTVSRHALALAGFFLGLDRAWLARRVRG